MQYRTMPIRMDRPMVFTQLIAICRRDVRFAVSVDELLVKEK